MTLITCIVHGFFYFLEHFFEILTLNNCYSFSKKAVSHENKFFLVSLIMKQHRFWEVKEKKVGLVDGFKGEEGRRGGGGRYYFLQNWIFFLWLVHIPEEFSQPKF